MDVDQIFNRPVFKALGCRELLQNGWARTKNVWRIFDQASANNGWAVVPFSLSFSKKWEGNCPPSSYAPEASNINCHKSTIFSQTHWDTCYFKSMHYNIGHFHREKRTLNIKEKKTSLSWKLEKHVCDSGGVNFYKCA